MLTVSSAAKRVPTFEDLYRDIARLPEGITGQILIPGVLTTMSRPGAAHDHTLARSSRVLDPFDQRLDPALRTIEAYESIDGRPTLVATARDAEVVRLPPFDAELSLAAWWRGPAVAAP